MVVVVDSDLKGAIRDHVSMLPNVGVSVNPRIVSRVVIDCCTIHSGVVVGIDAIDCSPVTGV